MRNGHITSAADFNRKLSLDSLTLKICVSVGVKSKGKAEVKVRIIRLRPIKPSRHFLPGERNAKSNASCDSTRCRVGMV